MPTPMTIEMENEMNKDEIEAALSSFNSAMAYNPKIMAHCEKEIIRAALQSALVKAETVDLDALKEKMISDFEEEKESELGRGYELGLCHAVDYLAQNYNITRKTK